MPLKKPGTIQKVQNPYPVSKATLQEYKDSYQSIFHDKRNYTKRLQKALRMYNSHKKFKHSWDTNSQGVIKIPVFLKDICTDGFKDPDCYFSEDNAYNWYFTGGVLDCFERNDYKYLLHWKADEGITISDLNGPGIHLILGKLKHHDVYCLKTYVTDYDIFITAREKNSVYLYRTDIKDNFTLDTILDINHLTSEDKPFFDFKLNRFSFMSFATCNAGQEVCIRDVAGTVISSRQLEELSSFCQMEYISSDRLVICQSKDLHFSDTRLQEMDKATLSLEPCQDICLMSPVDEKYLYIASTHDFMKFDIRSRKIVYRYSHLMKQPPHLMSVLREDGETTICLGNQDSKVLLYDCDSRYTTPLHVPNIQDTFKQMQLYSRFFLHVEDVEERLKSSNIGLVTVKLPNGTLIQKSSSVTQHGGLSHNDKSYSKCNLFL